MKIAQNNDLWSLAAKTFFLICGCFGERDFWDYLGVSNSRILDGLAIALVITLTPLYISEVALADIRGQLNTVTQFAFSSGMFLAYILMFSMSLTVSPSWRVMLGVISIPAVAYFLLAMFYLPESPRWLVSKGRILEAEKVLKRLRGDEDVSGELTLLAEGLNPRDEATLIEEYEVAPKISQGISGTFFL